MCLKGFFEIALSRERATESKGNIWNLKLQFLYSWSYGFIEVGLRTYVMYVRCKYTSWIHEHGSFCLAREGVIFLAFWETETNAHSQKCEKGGKTGVESAFQCFWQSQRFFGCGKVLILTFKSHTGLFQQGCSQTCNPDSRILFQIWPTSQNGSTNMTNDKHYHAQDM